MTEGTLPKALPKATSPQPRAGRLQHWLGALAALSCVLFVLGLSDTLRRVAPPSAHADLLAVNLRVTSVTGGSALEGALEGAAGAGATPPAVVTATPLPGADVRFFRETEGGYEYVARVAAAEDGRAAVRVPPGAYWVVARAPGRARLALPMKIQADRELALQLAPEERFVVTVREGTEPVPGAAVLVTASDRLPLAGATDAAGQLALQGLAGGQRDVRVVARGYEPFETTTSAGELDVQLRRALALRVVVTDGAGGRAVGADVQLSGPQLWPTRRVDTNAEGEVVISGLAEGTYDVFAQAGSKVSDTLRGVDLRHGAEQDGVLRVELVLREGRFLPVQVVDVLDQPIAQADLVLAEAGVAAFPLAARTDDAGRARLGPLRWQQAHLAVRADGFVPRSLWVGAEPLAPGEALKVELVRGGTIQGRVVDERGFPVEGVLLEVIGTDIYGMPVALTPDTSSVRKAHFAQVLEGPARLIAAGELGVMPGPVPPIPLAGLAVSTGASGSWTTDGRGQFVARGVSPGELRVLARHPDFVESVSDPVRLAAGGEAEIEVVLRLGRRIEGRLLDSDGFPVAQARLRLQAVRGAFDRTLLTRTDGTFAVAAAPRELVVSVFGVDDPLRVVLRRSVTMSDDPSERLDLELPEPRPDVRFEVVDESGDPLPVAQVSVLSLDPEVPLRETRFSAEDGSLEVSSAAGVHTRVLVDIPGYARFDKVFPELPELARVQLSRATSVAGRVTTVRGRQPAEGARVLLRGEGTRRETRTNASGEYTLRDVAPGKFTVSVEHAEYGRGVVEVTVVRQDHDRSFEVPLIDLVEPAVVRGRVVDAEGAPVEGARVAVGIVPSYLPQGRLPTGVVVTDSAGEFTLEGVEPGRCTISAYAPAVGRGRARLAEVEAGGEHGDVLVRLTEPLGEDAHDWRGGVAVTLGERDHRRGTSVVVVHVAEASEAERAGLQAGDVLTEIDGAPVTSMTDARARLGGPAGSDVVVALSRGEAPLRLRVTREALSR